jgi:hypothetical protein
MKNITDTRDYNPMLRDVSIHDAIGRILMADDIGRGELEIIKNDINTIRDVLENFLKMHIHTVDQLNELSGYERFEEKK